MCPTLHRQFPFAASGGKGEYRPWPLKFFREARWFGPISHETGSNRVEPWTRFEPISPDSQLYGFKSRSKLHRCPLSPNLIQTYISGLEPTPRPNLDHNQTRNPPSLFFGRGQNQTHSLTDFGSSLNLAYSAQNRSKIQPKPFWVQSNTNHMLF